MYFLCKKEISFPRPIKSILHFQDVPLFAHLMHCDSHLLHCDITLLSIYLQLKSDIRNVLASQLNTNTDSMQNHNIQ